MCGIVGIVDRDADHPVSADELRRMVQTLRHRGPDEEGSVTLPGVGLAMRRLSIVDLAGGYQPFSNEDGSIQLVANGEIYNFEALKEELLERGHRFRSRSDVEVLVHAYEEFGVEFLNKLRGMFALALWDARTRTLLAARDRAGEKPLYYAQTSRGLFLASEIKALIIRREIARELDLEALDQFLTYEYIIAPKTIFRDVKKLPAGHYLLYRDGTLTTTRYWDAANVTVKDWEEGEAAQAVRLGLQRAVTSQLMADVPVGVFLSGGIDSSAITAFMAQGCSEPIPSFSIGFQDGSYNELPHARVVAARFHTRHHEEVVSPDLTTLFEKLVVHLDEPFADVSLFPTYMVSQLAREHVKVVLSGDGGDELFAGYDAYAAHRLARRLNGFGPPTALRALAIVAAMMPPSDKKKGLVNKVRRFLQGAVAHPPDIEHYRWMTYLSAYAKRRLYDRSFAAALVSSDVYRPVRTSLRAIGSDDLLNRQLYADLSIYLADDILVKVDRMSMATSLETRAPFLDVDMMELAFSLPGHLKMRGHDRKYILKKALQDILPPSILRRKKEGFSIPMKTWLRRELAPLMDDLLLCDSLTRRDLFNAATVQRLVADHKAGRENHAHVLFSLMVFEAWAREFLS